MRPGTPLEQIQTPAGGTHVRAPVQSSKWQGDILTLNKGGARHAFKNLFLFSPSAAQLRLKEDSLLYVPKRIIYIMKLRSLRGAGIVAFAPGRTAECAGAQGCQIPSRRRLGQTAPRPWPSSYGQRLEAPEGVGPPPYAAGRPILYLDIRSTGSAIHNTISILPQRGAANNLSRSCSCMKKIFPYHGFDFGLGQFRVQ